MKKNSTDTKGATKKSASKPTSMARKRPHLIPVYRHLSSQILYIVLRIYIYIVIDKNKISAETL